jgi:hypothetical protein
VSFVFDRIVGEMARTNPGKPTEGENMPVENDDAWKEWEAALNRVTKAANAIKELRGSQDSQKMKAAEDELGAALEDLEEAAERITNDDDDED